MANLSGRRSKRRVGKFPSKTGRELFYVTPPPDRRIMVVGYTVNGESFLADKPRVWSDRLIIGAGLDLAPDGKHFVVFDKPEAAAQDKGSVHVTFLLNFFDELRRRAPAGAILASPLAVHVSYRRSRRTFPLVTNDELPSGRRGS